MVNIVMGTMKVVPSCAGGGGCPVNLEIIAVFSTSCHKV